MRRNWRPRGWSSAHGVDKLVALLDREAKVQCQRPVTLRRIEAVAARMHAPVYALRAAAGVFEAWESHGRKKVTFVGYGGSRWEGPGMYRRVSEHVKGLAEHAQQSRTQTIKGQAWVVEHELVIKVPAGGVTDSGRIRGGRGIANGYAPGPAMGGPRIPAELLAAFVAPRQATEDGVPPEESHPLQDAETLARWRREREAALMRGRAGP